MKLFTLKWKSVECRNNTLKVVIKAINERGKVYVLRKQYREWFGLCGPDSLELFKQVRKKFGRCKIRKLGGQLYKPMFPAFLEKWHNRTTTENSSGYPFYKIYPQRADSYEVGQFYRKRGAAYYEKAQFLTRIYLDLRSKFGSLERFYYGWFDVDLREPNLLDAFTRAYEDDTRLPPIKILAFDLEVVPYDRGSTRFPDGTHVKDVITMASYATNNGGDEKVFYLLPRADMKTDVASDVFVPCETELELITRFLDVIEQDKAIQVVTGFNILNYDLPVLVARLAYYAYLKNVSVAKRYIKKISSHKIGKYVVATFCKRAVIDMYHFMINFSPYGLSSFKLDNIADKRLGHRKVPISPVDIHKIYQARSVLPDDFLLETDFERVKRIVPEIRDATFPTCLEYSLVDAQLVAKLFERENALQFLVSRSNMCATMDMEESLLYGNSRYVETVLQNCGTDLRFFVDLSRLKNVDSDGEDCLFVKYAKIGQKKYQGALNLSADMSHWRQVRSFDFESLYPSCIQCFNISADTFAVVSAKNYFDNYRDSLPDHIATNFSTHGEADFVADTSTTSPFLREPANEGLVVLYSTSERGFLPTVLTHFKTLRRKYKRLMNADRFYYTYQLMCKLVMNSLYGLLGSEDSKLYNFGMAMCVTFFARKVLLAAYARSRSLGYSVPYADTDSVFLVGAEEGLAEEINAYIGFPEYINIVPENFYTDVIIISKKKYCTRKASGAIQTKGFELKSNQVARSLLEYVLNECFRALDDDIEDGKSRGWGLLQDVLRCAFVESRLHPALNIIDRKVKPLDQYSEKTTAPHVRLMRKLDYKERNIQFNYVMTDFSIQGDKQFNPRLPEEGTVTDFEQLIVTQKKNIISLLCIVFFKVPTNLIMLEYAKITQSMRWKTIVHAALKCKLYYDEDLLLCFKKDLKYKLKY